MKKIFITSLLLILAVSLTAQKKIYINPGHGSWGPNDRPCATIPYPMLASTGRPDTCGFYETNTNLWKCEELARRLQKAGYTIRMSRYANGPYPYTSSGANAYKYNRSLSEICEEVEAWGGDMFISVHSNATSDGSLTNYPLFLYRGTDAEESVKGSKAMASTIWPWHVEYMKSGFEFQNYYNNSTNIRGDIDFYHSSSTSSLGYTGYLGVLKHGTPGFLVEGYFHTYQPARHRALNRDFCRQEGMRYYRGISKYFGTETDKTGCIMGAVKDQSQTMDGYSYYAYKAGTHDAYLPLNGTTVRLRNAKGEPAGAYTVDQNYNGIFVFFDLEPGTYYIDLLKDGYATQQATANKVTVQANATTYPILYMQKGTSTPFETIEGRVSISLEGKGTVSVGEYSITEGFGNTKVECGQDATFTIMPDEGYKIDSVFLNGEDITRQLDSNGRYTLSPVSSNISLRAVFKLLTYNLTVITRVGGSVTLLDSTISRRQAIFSVGHGSNVSVKITCDEGKAVRSCKLNGTEILPELQDGQYTIRDIKKATTLSVYYEAASSIRALHKEGISLTRAGGTLTLEGLPSQWHISLIGLDGQMLQSESGNGATLTIPLPRKGNYLLIINGKGYKLKL